MLTLKNVDPRIKLLMLAVLSSIAVFSRSVIVLALLLLLTAVMLLTGGVPLRRIYSQTRKFLRVIIMLFVIQCIFTRSGEPLLRIYGFTVVTYTGLHTAALVALRLLIVVSSALIVLTGESRDYLLALTQLRLPYELAFMVIVALRFIPMLREEAKDVFAAVQMRGLNIKKAPFKQKISAYASVMVPIVAGTLHRSEQTSIAMEARGFRSRPTRTYMRKLTLKPSDFIYLFIFIAAVAALFLIKDVLICTFS